MGPQCPAGMKEAESAFREQLGEIQSKIMELKTLEKDLLESLDYLAGCKVAPMRARQRACHACVRSGAIDDNEPRLILGLTLTEPQNRINRKDRRQNEATDLHGQQRDHPL